jgi:hypothetical protein
MAIAVLEAHSVIAVLIMASGKSSHSCSDVIHTNYMLVARQKITAAVDAIELSAHATKPLKEVRSIKE